MTVSQLIVLLQRKLARHGDRDVTVTWESTVHDIEPDGVWLATDGDLRIDADHNFYKREGIAVDPEERDE